MKAGTHNSATGTRKWTPPNTIEVWDLPLRLFHWSLVGTVTAAAVTGFLMPENWLDVHVWAGYALGILLAFRIIWGFAGSSYSRFRRFPLAPGKLLTHLRALKARETKPHAGHNPAGAWMIVLLLSLLIALTITGFITLGGQENLGPLAAFVNFKTGELFAEFHEILAWAIILVVPLHIAGALAEEFLLGHGVIKAMFTGRKPAAPAPPQNGKQITACGLAVLLLVAASGTTGVQYMTSLPASGWHQAAPSETYQEACAECHHAHHPSLRSAADWRALISGLPDHFGEDASLDEDTTRAITAYLTRNAAGTFDTEAANNIGRVHTASLRMTDTGYWKARHAQIDPASFTQKTVGSRVNCDACHQDANSGRFDDHAISTPLGDTK